MKTIKKKFYVKLCTQYWVGIFDTYPLYPTHSFPFWDISVEDWNTHMGEPIEPDEIKIMSITVEDEVK